MAHFKERFRVSPENLGYVLVAAPILIYWLYWTFNPSYWFNGDPAAFYFLDSLSVFIGRTYVYVDHPGTPMQIIGSLLLALTYPFLGGTQAFINFYITRPEAFFLMAHLFLLAMNLIAAVVFYDTARTTLRHNQILGALSLSLIYFTLHPHSFPSLTFWSHNSFNFPFGTLWLLWLYRGLRADKEIDKWKLILLGIGAGVLAIAQVYFFAWVIAGIFSIFVFTQRLTRSFKSAVSSSLYIFFGSILGIVSMLLPIYKELPRFVNWFMDVATHEGLYGTGQSGILSSKLLSTSLYYWWLSIRPMMIVLALTLVILGALAYFKTRFSIKVSPSTFAMITVLLFMLGLILLMLVKTAGKLRYSLSLAAILPVLILLVLKLAETIFQKNHKWVNLFYVTVFIGIAVTLTQQINLQQRRAFVEQDARLAKSQAITRLAREIGVPEKELVVVFAYGVPIQCSGMLEASNWTGAFTQEISSMCHNQHAIFDTEVELNTARPLVEIQEIDWDLVIWPGNGSDLPEYLESVGAVNIPKAWHVRRSPWFFIRPDVE